MLASFSSSRRISSFQIIIGLISSSIFITVFLIAQLMNIVPRGPWSLSLGVLLLSIPIGITSQEIKHVIVCSLAAVIISTILTIFLTLIPVFTGYLGEVAGLYVISIVKWALGNIYLLIPVTIGGSVIGYFLREIFLS